MKVKLEEESIVVNDTTVINENLLFGGEEFDEKDFLLKGTRYTILPSNEGVKGINGEGDTFIYTAQILDEDKPYYNTDVIIINTEQPYEEILPVLKDVNTKLIILNKEDYKMNEIQKMWKNYNHKAKIQQYTLKEINISETYPLFKKVVDDLPRIYDENAKKIWNGEKDLILKEEIYHFCLNQKYYLTDETRCYGVIELKSIDKVEPKEFKELKRRHCLTNEDRKNKWNTFNKILYSYEFEVHELFEKPLKVHEGKEFTNQETNFVNAALKTELKRNLEGYTPVEEEKELYNDWMTLTELYNNKIIDAEFILNAGQKIYNKVVNQGLSKSKLKEIDTNFYYILSEDKLSDVDIFNPLETEKEEIINLET